MVGPVHIPYLSVLLSLASMCVTTSAMFEAQNKHLLKACDPASGISIAIRFLVNRPIRFKAWILLGTSEVPHDTSGPALGEHSNA